MSQTERPLRGHVILVATLHAGTQPSSRAYLVAENGPMKARSLIARHIRRDEIAYVLAALPDVLDQIPGLERGGANAAVNVRADWFPS
jgi:hypothetical protein